MISLSLLSPPSSSLFSPLHSTPLSLSLPLSTFSLSSTFLFVPSLHFPSLSPFLSHTSLPLSAAPSPLSPPSPNSELHEVAAMNNYFGIGLDAKITYEFHTRREENPKQYTSVSLALFPHTIMPSAAALSIVVSMSFLCYCSKLLMDPHHFTLTVSSLVDVS